MDHVSCFNNLSNLSLLLERLLKKQVGTREVENAAKRLFRLDKAQRNIGFVNYVMQRKAQRAGRESEHEKKKHRYHLKQLGEKINNVAIFGEYCRIAEGEATRQWESQRKMMKEKVNHLEKTYKPWKREVQGRLKDICIGDTELEQLEHQNDDRRKREAAVYGGVKISEPTRQLLRYQPKLAVWPKLDMTNIMTEVEKGCAKRRWGEMSKIQNGDCEMNEAIDETEEEMASTRVYDSRECTVNLLKMRVTQLPTNKRVIVPEQQGPELEEHLQHLKARLQQATKSYMAAECDDRGNLKQKVLNETERVGMKEALKLTKEGRLVIFPTDKSGRFSLDSYENYVECMKEHVENDEAITEKEKEKMVRQLNGHSSMLGRALGLCANHCSVDDERHVSALKQDVYMLPLTTSGLRKDHKKVQEGQEKKGLPLRPVCYASSAPNNVLSSIVAPIIRVVAEEAENRAIASTEEMIANLKKVNERIREKEEGTKRKIGIGSMDCKALYPSLSREWVKRILFEMIENTKVKVEVENWNELALYIALTHKQEEIDEAGLGDMVHK